MKTNKLVTLLVLVALLLTSVASVGATPPASVTICHVTPGGENTLHLNENGLNGHMNDNGSLHGDDYYGECDGRTLPDDDDDSDVCEWNESLPADSDECQPPDDGGDDDDDDGDDDEGEVCEWNESLPADDPACVEPDDGDDDDSDVCEWDETLPVDSDECQPPDDGGDDDDDDDTDNDNGNDGNGNNSQSEPYVPPYIQITVWPDTAQMTSNVVGFMWKANGSWVYADRNGNGAEDLGERIITGTEYRDRPVWGTSTTVYGQALSRLVTGVRLGEVGDLNAFLSSFEAYLVLNDGTVVRAYGWYDINGEWMPLGADGVSQYRPQ